jgi:hypothetical protein
MGQLLDELPRRRFEASRRQPITSIQFEERARRYRLAAALTDRRRDRETFGDWAGMFEKIAFDLERLEANNLERRITMKMAQSKFQPGQGEMHGRNEKRD